MRRRTVGEEKKLASGRSARWAFMDRFEVPQYDSDGIYLTRWRVIQTPWGGLYVHRYEGPDPRRTLHDHPWRFLSLVIRGGYVERRLDPKTLDIDEHHVIDSYNRIGAHDAHSIVSLLRIPTWTVLFVGRRVRTWGYVEMDALGRWLWTEFDKHRHNDEFKAALARRKERAHGTR